MNADNSETMLNDMELKDFLQDINILSDFESAGCSPAQMNTSGTTPRSAMSLPAESLRGHEFNLRASADGSSNQGNWVASDHRGVATNAMAGQTKLNNAIEKYRTQPSSVLAVRRNIAEQEAVKNRKRDYNTTGTCPDHTVNNPDMQQVIYCVAAVLQTEIIAPRESYLLDYTAEHYPEMNIDLVIDCIPKPESTELSSTGEPLHPNSCFTYMVQFISYIHNRCACNSECVIVALIYINRITSSNENFKLDPHNWRNLWVACVIIATKMWNDESYTAAAYTEVSRSLSKTALRNMERHALALISFNISIKASLYTKYYFELRCMYRKFCPEKTDLPLSSLGVAAQQCEVRSKSRSFVKRRKRSHKHDLESTSSRKSRRSASAQISLSPSSSSSSASTGTRSYSSRYALRGSGSSSRTSSAQASGSRSDPNPNRETIPTRLPNR